MKSLTIRIGFILLGIFLNLIVLGQGEKITGKVLSKGDNLPLSGVSIVVKGKKIGTQTNENAMFSIEAKAGDILVFSSSGYLDLQVAVSTLKTLTILLEQSESKLDEVVIIGYGSQSKSKITGSVSKLDQRVIQSGVRSNPASALAGTIPGLRVQQTSGRPGAVPSIVLRGGTNYNGSGSPLVIVDGLLRAGFSEVNQEDIESIEVLKDASATAIYGARANNGVVLITTKKGKAGQSKVTASSKVGINKLNIPFEFLNARDYLTYSRNAIKTSGGYDPSRLSQFWTFRYRQ